MTTWLKSRFFRHGESGSRFDEVRLEKREVGAVRGHVGDDEEIGAAAAEVLGLSHDLVLYHLSCGDRKLYTLVIIPACHIALDVPTSTSRPLTHTSPRLHL